MILIAVVAVLVVTVIALPASLARRALPPFMSADDFSGTLWHGSAARITANGRDWGALEWRLHPLALLRLALAADLHWVKIGFAADAAVEIESQSITVRNLEGDGPIADLGDLGIGQYWTGTTSFKFSLIKATVEGGVIKPTTVVGDVSVADISSPQVANGANLGGYVLHLADAAIAPQSDLSADLTDTGGPLELDANIHASMAAHTGLLSGTIKERPSAPVALRAQVESMAQLHARDAQGRVPFDFEFTF
jgi:hypothetical protein